VLYVEEKSFKVDPYRQRIYTVIVDAATNEVRVKLWNFKDEEKYLGAWKDPKILQGLTPEEMSPLPDQCDMSVSPLDDGRLHMKMRDCAFGEKLFDYQVILGPGSFWFRPRSSRSGDSPSAVG
jgi:hypothetical protein